MPDINGKLSQEELDKIKEWLEKKAKARGCPFCGYNNFDIGNTLVRLSSHPKNSRITIDYPCFIILCGNCTHTMLFNANKEIMEFEHAKKDHKKE